MTLTGTVTRGKLAELTGCNSETIRYYERVGMLHPPQRAENGYRLYSEDHVKRLGFIARAKALGFTTDAIRGLLEITDDSSRHTRAEVKQMTEQHIGDISRKIADLESLRARLNEISEQCDGARESAEACPILKSIYEDR